MMESRLGPSLAVEGDGIKAEIISDIASVDSAISSQKSEDAIVKRDTYEVFRYKVVYPGGTFLRISPALDAKKTGEILEYGSIFDASKSLFLDGINYAKLSDGSGWVFENKNNVQILELLQIIRVPCDKVLKGKSITSASQNSSTESLMISDNTALSQSIGRSLSVPTLMDNRTGVPTLGSEKSVQSISQIPAQRQQAKVENRQWRDVRARCGACDTFDDFLQLATVLKISFDGIHSQHEQRVISCINLIASITGHCSSQVTS
jgi:hypothetical protein